MRCSRQLTNWPSSLSDTSFITLPRPNWAALPVMARSVVTETSVEPGSVSVMTAVTFAPAVPLPRLSLPLASMTIRWADSSFSTKVPEPL